MQTDTIHRPKNKDFFPTRASEFVSILVAYKVSGDTWKGFVSPYGETTEADTKEEAIERMRILTAAYKSAVKEYDNPKHLVYAGLTDMYDRKVFAWVVGNEEIMKKIHSQAGVYDSKDLYVEALRG